MRHPQHRIKSQKVSVFKSVTETPQKFSGSLCPINLEEQKERFLRHGILPKFVLNSSADRVAKLVNKDRGQIRFDYLSEAKYILDTVKEKYGDGHYLIEEAYGPKVDYVLASGIIADYLKEHGLEGEMTIYWTPDLTCTARMMWHGPNLKYNKPEARKYTLIIKNTTDNNFLREYGITCLVNHEVGTHYFRMLNDGLQPWFSNRKLFGLRSSSTRESTATEEGLAAINTILQSQTKYLWTAAMLYYTACMGDDLSFRDLYDHLGKYVKDPEQRWKHVMRVKRGLKDPNQPGGYGMDQCYFEGAVEILRNLDNIDFNLLYSGKVCYDELPRIRRLARLDCIKTPKFLRDIEKYKRTLKQIAIINGIIKKPTPPQAKPLRKRPKSRRKTDPPIHTPTPPPIKSKRQNPSPTSSTDSSGSLIEHKFKPLPRIKASHRRRRSSVKPCALAETGVTDMPEEWVDEEDAEEEEEEDGEEEEEGVVEEKQVTGKHPANRRLLGRARSSQNKMSDKKKRSHKKRKSARKQGDLGWFGLLDRNAEIDQEPHLSSAPKT